MNSTALATIGSYSVVTTTKSGKSTTRDMIGVVSSGNRAARNHALQSLVTHQFCAGQFGMIAANMARVFGKTFTDNAGFVQLNPATGVTMNKESKSTRACWADMLGGLQRAHDNKAFKGEKAIWLETMNNAALTYKAQQAAKATEDAAAAALVAAGLNTVDVTATEAAPLALAAPETEVDARVNADAEVTA